jgi:hypothetical protein
LTLGLDGDEFSKQIFENSKFQNMHLGRATAATPFKIHRDDKSNSAITPDVVCRSIIHEGTRYAVNCQNKKSMDQLHERVVKTRDLTNDMLEI